VAVPVRAKEGGETRWRIKARPAQPVDRTIAPDQGRGMTVTDHRVILDARATVIRRYSGMGLDHVTLFSA
jgi:hypothetical protein